MNILAAITGEQALYALIWLVIGGIIFYVLNWGLAKMGLPEPFNKIINVLLILVVVIVLINALLTLVGHGFIRFSQ